MSTSDFFYGPRVRLGAGCAATIADLIDGERLLVVTDRGVRSAGLLDATLAALGDAGKQVIVFDAVEPDPSRATVEAGLEMLRASDCEAVIGFGGGSPMDVAKLIAYLAGSGENLDDIWGVNLARGARLPLILVPTTAGTGSEATPVTIITVGGAEKRGVSSARLIPDWAVLDPLLTLGLPRAATAATGIDAMVHAIEAYTSSKLKNPFSDALAREALRLLDANLVTACDEPHNVTARAAMLLGAHYAGVAFSNAPVGGVHALAYPLGGHFHVPHGLANALMLTEVLEFNMPSAMPLYAELGVVLDQAAAEQGQQGQARVLVDRMRALVAATGLATKLSAVGVSSADLDLLASEALKQERLLGNNPVPIALADARRMYEAVL